MGAGGFHVRVRDGIGWGAAAMATRSSDAITCPCCARMLHVHMRRGRGEVLVIRLAAGCVCCAMAMLACVAVCAVTNARSTKGLAGDQPRGWPATNQEVGRDRRGMTAVQGGRCCRSRSGD